MATETAVLSIKRTKSPEFQLATRPVKNPYKFQFAIDFGVEPGYWFGVIFNGTCYGFGYLPKEKPSESAKKNSSVRNLASARPLAERSNTPGH